MRKTTLPPTTTRRTLNSTRTVAISVMVSIAIFGAAGCGVASWSPNTVPQSAGLDASTVIADLSYGPLDQQRLDLYLPNKRSLTPTPVVLYIHGGAWILSSKEEGMRNAGPISNLLNEGWAVAAMSYRLANETSKHPDALHDTKRAIRWLKVNAARYDLDPTTVVVAGHSSGGHLALLAGLAADEMEPAFDPPLTTVDSRPDAVIAIAPVVDLPQFSLLDPEHPERIFQRSVAAYFGCPISQPICDPVATRQANPLSFLDPDDPPVYLLHGRDDWVVPIEAHSQMAANSLAAVLGDSRVWFDVFEGVDHDLVGIDANRLIEFVTQVRLRQFQRSTPRLRPVVNLPVAPHLGLADHD